MELRQDISQFINTIPNKIRIVAATKYIDVDVMKMLYNYGISDFGENRVDSFLRKYEALKDIKDIRWHFIGHLQRNKAKDIINKIDMLHSLDSLELAKMIDKLRDKPLDTFIEVSINLEENKNGVPYYEVKDFINKVKEYKNVHLVGLMMMAVHNSEHPYDEFIKLSNLRDELEEECNISLPFLSMGMSDDYEDAIEANATHLRLGRILFSK